MAEIYDLNSGELKNGGVAEKSKDNQYIIPPCTPEEWETIVPTENDFKNVKHANKKIWQKCQKKIFYLKLKQNDIEKTLHSVIEVFMKNTKRMAH